MTNENTSPTPEPAPAPTMQYERITPACPCCGRAVEALTPAQLTPDDFLFGHYGAQWHLVGLCCSHDDTPDVFPTQADAESERRRIWPRYVKAGCRVAWENQARRHEAERDALGDMVRLFKAEQGIDDGERRGGGSRSTECEGAYLMSY